jgi:hypothetical protein
MRNIKGESYGNTLNTRSKKESPSSDDALDDGGFYAQLFSRPA